VDQDQVVAALADLDDDAALAVVNAALQRKREHQPPTDREDPTAMPPQPDPLPPPGHAKLLLNARGYRFDPVLDRAADLFDSDPEAWQRLPVQVQDRSGIYRDLRETHRRAVAAGVITEETP